MDPTCSGQGCPTRLIFIFQQRLTSTEEAEMANWDRETIVMVVACAIALAFLVASLTVWTKGRRR